MQVYVLKAILANFRPKIEFVRRWEDKALRFCEPRSEILLGTLRIVTGILLYQTGVLLGDQAHANSESLLGGVYY